MNKPMTEDEWNSVESEFSTYVREIKADFIASISDNNEHIVISGMCIPDPLEADVVYASITELGWKYLDPEDGRTSKPAVVHPIRISLSDFREWHEARRGVRLAQHVSVI